jgi:hypothetical protein
MIDLGLLHYFLGMSIFQDHHSIIISPKKYARKLISKFNMFDCKPFITPIETSIKLESHPPCEKIDSTLYRQLVGILIYLAISHLDISYAIGVASQFMQEPYVQHWKMEKCILRYIKGTINFGLYYTHSKNAHNMDIVMLILWGIP